MLRYLPFFSGSTYKRIDTFNAYGGVVMPWWCRNDMETLTALMALCEGNPPATTFVSNTVDFYKHYFITLHSRVDFPLAHSAYTIVVERLINLQQQHNYFYMEELASGVTNENGKFVFMYVCVCVFLKISITRIKAATEFRRKWNQTAVFLSVANEQES